MTRHVDGCYIGAIGLCLFNTVSFLVYFLTLTPSVNSCAEYIYIYRYIYHVICKLLFKKINKNKVLI